MLVRITFSNKSLRTLKILKNIYILYTFRLIIVCFGSKTSELIQFLSQCNKYKIMLVFFTYTYNVPIVDTIVTLTC